LQIIKELRQERGLTQQQLAELAGVDKVTLIRIETGRGNPTVETLGKLATALGVEMADLFPKVQSSLFRVPPDQATQEERRAEWDVAVRRAHQLRERGRTRMEGLLSAWRASKARREPLDARRDYLDEMAELLQEGYDAETGLLRNLEAGLAAGDREAAELLASGSKDVLNPGFEEYREASHFYGALLAMVEGAGLHVRRGPEAHEVADAA